MGSLRIRLLLVFGVAFLDISIQDAR